MNLRAIAAQQTLLASRLSAIERLVAAGALTLDVDIIADPAPDGGGFGGFQGGLGGIGGIGGGLSPVADPAPEDLRRLSRVQIEARLSEIKFARSRLDTLEGMFNEALEAQR